MALTRARERAHVRESMHGTRNVALCTVAAVLIVAIGLTARKLIAADRSGCAWTQWGQSASHTGQGCVAGDKSLRIIAQHTVDPFAQQEIAESGSDALTVHYPTPLVGVNFDVFVMRKGGRYRSCNPPASGRPFPCGAAAINEQEWIQEALEWRHGRLAVRWTFTSDWKPLPSTWEPMFQSALGGDYIYIPGAGGTVFQLEQASGKMVRRINPFGPAIDTQANVSGGITTDRDGNVYYNVIRLETSGADVDAHSWLVRVSPDGAIQMADYRTLIPDAPKPTDLCYATFALTSAPRPWPPPPQSDGSPTLPPRVSCQSQRAPLNVTPAIGPDGTIFTVSRAHSATVGHYAYLIALRPDLTFKWAASLRGRLNDGCGVLIRYGTGAADCRAGATPGVDPATNLPPAGQASDLSSSSPTALPDGSVLYGAFTSYNGSRGHLMKFNGRGEFVASFDYGWDLTPAIDEHDNTYSILIKNNHYTTNGPFYMTRLDANLKVEWNFKNPSTDTCERRASGQVACINTGQHPDGFDWCVNAPIVDRAGNVYGLNEDGFVYVIDSAGHERERVFLGKTLFAAYTPIAIDFRGWIYAQNNGELYVLGR